MYAVQNDADTLTHKIESGSAADSSKELANNHGNF